MSGQRDGGVQVDFSGPIYTASPGAIRCFADIPDIVTMDIPAVDFLVPALGIARNTITLWTGSDGDAKTYLAQAMSVAVARGTEFLGMRCQKAPVLYIDLENAAFVVQERLQALIADEASPPELRVWGMWNQHQPPQADSAILLDIARQERPVILIDPFRYFHDAEENDSTAMLGVMQYLRQCATLGCAVILLHHPAKAEGSTGRGSSAIRGACDLGFLHSLDRSSGLITLKVDKNRFGASRTITIRADFEEGRFELADAPYITHRNDELEKIGELIKRRPGISQNGICKEAGMAKARVLKLLNEGSGTLWTTESGPKNSKRYFSCSGPVFDENSFSCSDADANSLFSKAGTTRTGGNGPNGSAVLPPIGENNRTSGPATAVPDGEFNEDVNRISLAGKPNGGTLSSCPQCGGFAVDSRDGTCFSCEQRA